MKPPVIRRLLSLIFGLFLYGLGVTLQIQAQVGYAPWDILHVGIAKTIGWSIGQVSITVGFIIVFIDLMLKERLGIGTIANMVLVGIFVDLLMPIIPAMTNLCSGLVMLIAGMFVLCFGMYFYIGSGFGAGPRDTLMVAIHRRFGISPGLARSIIELVAAFLGWRLGGMLGIGTVLSVGLIGPIVQFTFRLLKFEPKTVVHETLADYFQTK